MAPNKSAVTIALKSAIARFEALNPESASQHQKAIVSLPGGNTRATLHTSPFPVYITRGVGTTLTTADGAILTDFVGELTAGIYGHSHPVLRSAVIRTFDTVGMSLGGTTEAEATFAALICQRFGLDRVRFTNSGTEAGLHAVLTTRWFTGRSKIVLFNAAYHGSLMWVGADSTLPANTVNPNQIVVLRYNDMEQAKQFFATEEAKDIAAVMVEPMQGGGGAIPGDPEFLLGLQRCAHEVGALLIMDEVMTSRFAPGGLQSTIPGLKPDITVLGKYLGGGFPFGAFGGREDVMAVFDPRCSDGLKHMGTFNNDSMTINVGCSALRDVFTPDACILLNETGDRLRGQLNAMTEGTRLGFTGIGSVMQLHVTNEGVRERELRNAADVEESKDIVDLFWFEMLEQRFWTHKRGQVILSLGMPQEELDRFVVAVAEFKSRYEEVLKI